MRQTQHKKMLRGYCFWSVLREIYTKNIWISVKSHVSDVTYLFFLSPLGTKSGITASWPLTVITIRWSFTNGYKCRRLAMVSSHLCSLRPLTCTWFGIVHKIKGFDHRWLIYWLTRGFYSLFTAYSKWRLYNHISILLKERIFLLEWLQLQLLLLLRTSLCTLY